MPAASRPRLDLFAIATLVALVAVAAACRQAFSGDGTRHVVDALGTPRAPIGEVRWLLFPTLVWALARPLAEMGWIASVDAALRPLSALTVAAGAAYLLALRRWLIAIDIPVRSRAAAVAMAAATAPFLALYSDFAEPPIAAALVVCALARTASLTRAGRMTGGQIAIAAGAIAAASLLYQGVVLGLALLPLCLDAATLRRRSTWAIVAATAGGALVFAVALRVHAGDSATVAIRSISNGGERSELTRAFLGTASAAKWVVAAIVGPAQAFVALDRFAGLPALASAIVRGPARGAAVVNGVRLTVGLLLLAALASAIVVHRDWRLALAIASVIALPVLRNNQYAYAKFFVLWPALVAVAASRFPAARVFAVAVVLLALNGSLVAREIQSGRAEHAEALTLYRTVPADACFLTSGWGAPFQHLWPGRTVAVIAELTMSTEASGLARDIGACFCDAPIVWTDTPAESAATVRFIADRFEYRAVDIAALLPTAEERTVVAAFPTPIFQYTADRARDACRRVRAR